MRKTARIIGFIIISVIAGGLLFITAGGIFEGAPISTDIETLGMAILSLVTIASVITAWVKVRLGVWLVLGAGILFSIFALVTAGRNHLLAVMSVGGPLIIGGLLIFWGRQQKKPSA
jgi:hypothetical protein